SLSPVADERVAWFREEIAAFSMGDREPDWNRIHPDFELHSRMMLGAQKGPDALRAWIEEIDQQFDAWQLRAEREIELEPDRYLLLGGLRMRGRGSGLEMDMEAAWILEFEGERLRVLWPYTDHESAISEAGLAAEDISE